MSETLNARSPRINPKQKAANIKKQELIRDVQAHMGSDFNSHQAAREIGTPVAFVWRSTK